MKIHCLKDAVSNEAPNGITGQQLAAESDGLNFMVYHISVVAKETVSLNSPSDDKLHHIYYCISGAGSVTTQDGRSYDFDPDKVIACSSKISMKMTASCDVRLFVIFCKDEAPDNPRMTVRAMSETIGTDLDYVLPMEGYSRRMLVKDDGFPVSINALLLPTGEDRKFAHFHHTEGAYLISGAVEISWDEDKQFARGTDDTLLLFNDYGKCREKVVEKARMICVWSPPLLGPERLIEKDGYIGYELLKE
ncbi:L-ectoine synthase-like [Glandiceps talaboti]